MGCYARGKPMYFQNKIQLSESAWTAHAHALIFLNSNEAKELFGLSVSWPLVGTAAKRPTARLGRELKGSPRHSSFCKPCLPSNTLHISSDWKGTKPPPAGAMEIYCELEGVVWSCAVSINFRWKDLRKGAVRLPRSLCSCRLSPRVSSPCAISIKLSGSLRTTLHRYHFEFFFPSFFPLCGQIPFSM